MKVLFASLLCHRDVEIFKFNWFVMRAQLDCGFDFPHLVLNDGSLTESDKTSLKTFPGLILEEKPIKIYNAPKAVLLGKLECLKRGFEQYGADRVVVFDCDIFFLRNWDSDLRKILTEKTVVLRDWCGSLGPNIKEYKELFGVYQDTTTPNCNTGVISVLKEDYPKIEEKLQMHLAKPFLIMEDQGIMFAAFYGALSYVNGIKCLINNIESHPKMWNWVLKQNAVHLMGMRTRPFGLRSLVEHSLKNLPEFLHLKQFTPSYRYISWGLLTYDHLNFSLPLELIPSTSGGEYISDALYLHGGSHVRWTLPKRCNRFTTKIVCMDTGIPTNVGLITINEANYNLNDTVDIKLEGFLDIKTQNGPGTHLAFLEPKLYIDKSSPDLSHQVV